MALQDIAQTTVTGLGYDLVEIERSAGGLLRITIDLPWQAGAPALTQAQLVTVEDCEKVTRQLQFALEVEGVEYKRLEVSSPGIDRPLRHQADFERFVGEIIDVTLKAPLGKDVTAASGGTSVNANRKKFRGVLEKHPSVLEKHASDQAMWQITWQDEPAAKPGQKISRKRAPAPVQALGFRLDEIKEARLASIVDFNGKFTGKFTGNLTGTTNGKE